MVIDILADTIADIKKKIDSNQVRFSVPEYASSVHIESIKDLTDSSLDTRGNYFQDLSNEEPYRYRSYKAEFSDEPPVANLRSGVEFYGPNWYSDQQRPRPAKKPKAIESLYGRTFDSESTLNFYSIRAHEYMGNHQEGVGDLPQRKWFPTEEDFNYTPQQENAEMIGKYLGDILNAGTIIKVING